jgi:hypothetical protein
VTSPIAVHERVKRGIQDAASRDGRMREIRLVRSGDVNHLYPGLFSEDFPRPIVANMIDTAARDLAETIAPLPALKCSSKSMATETDRKRAAVREHIGYDYWKQSKLAVQMFWGADRYLSYGFLPIYSEVDFDSQSPVIRVEDPIGCYYQKNRFGKVIWFAKRWAEPAQALAARFPEHAARILRTNEFGEESKGQHLEVIRYCDADQWILYLPDRECLVLSAHANLTKDCPVQVAERPGLDEESRGQWDQVAWVQLAKARFAMLSLEAAHKAVTAPMVLPKDVAELSLGPDAVIQTDNPQGVGRVRMELPQSAMAFSQQLQEELMRGARYPEGRMGGVDASVITGRGIQALLGGFDTQIKTAQVLLGEAIARATEYCFELDVKVYGGTRKHIQGTMSGKPYDLYYTPSTDIADNTRADVTYGYAAGMSPNQAIVALLQLRGDNLISRSTFRDQLPFDIDAEQEQRDIDLEQTSDAMLQGLFGIAQASGQLIAQGQDPMPILHGIAKFMDLRRKGKDTPAAMIAAFAPPEPTPEEQAAQAQPDAAAAGAPAEAGAGGLGAPQEAPLSLAGGGAAQMPAAGLQQLVAGLRNGSPQMNASVSRRSPIAA